MRRPVLLVSLGTVAALALVGCSQSDGPKDDPSTSAEKSPSVDAGSDDELASCLVGSWDLDASFLQSAVEEGMADPTVSFNDVVFTATQTQTLDEDKTFTAELDVEMSMTMASGGQSIPMTVSGTGSAAGTWKVDDGELVMTVDERDGVGTMSSAGQTIEMPDASSLGQMLLLPTELFPVTCSGDTMKIEVEGMSDAISGAPEELVATRQ